MKEEDSIKQKEDPEERDWKMKRRILQQSRIELVIQLERNI